LMAEELDAAEINNECSAVIHGCGCGHDLPSLVYNSP
jgi:hypothetical protein